MPTKCIICNKEIEGSYYVKYVCADCRINYTEKKQPKIKNIKPIKYNDYTIRVIKPKIKKHKIVKVKNVKEKKRPKNEIKKCKICGGIINYRKTYCNFCILISEKDNYENARKWIAEQNKTLEYNFIKYKKSAEKRKIAFELSINEFGAMWQKDCYYCGSQIKTIGVDRINSKDGYNVQNTVPCCTMCNMMKYTYSVDTFMNHIKKIHEFNNLRNN